MKTKNIISIALLLFVGASVVYLVAGEFRGNATTVRMADAKAEQDVRKAEQTRTAKDATMPEVAPGQDNQSLEPTDGETPATISETTARRDARTAETQQQENPATSQPRHKVIAYYFYGTVRCSTCRTIEAYAEEAIKNGFQSELQSGALEWRAVNVNIPENEHFIRDYELTTRSVVLADIWDGQQKQWKNLARVWQLVRNRQAFTSYIQEETRKYLAGSYE